MCASLITFSQPALSSFCAGHCGLSHALHIDCFLTIRLPLSSPVLYFSEETNRFLVKYLKTYNGASAAELDAVKGDARTLAANVSNSNA